MKGDIILLELITSDNFSKNEMIFHEKIYILLIQYTERTALCLCSSSLKLFFQTQDVNYAILLKT